MIARFLSEEDVEGGGKEGSVAAGRAVTAEIMMTVLGSPLVSETIVAEVTALLRIGLVVTDEVRGIGVIEESESGESSEEE